MSPVLLGFGFLVIALMGCSRPRNGEFRDVDAELGVESRNLELMLTEPQLGQEFVMGSILIWDPSVSGEAVSQMVAISNRRQEIQQKILRERLHTVMNSGGNELLRLTDELADVKRERAQRIDAVIRARAIAWFGSQLDQTAQPFDRERSERMFSWFCQAKLWERAVEPTLIDAMLIRRPSPLLLCESVYENLGLMEYAGAAACQPNPSGQHFFECLWTEGVLKTPLFSDFRYGHRSQIRTQLSSVNAEILRLNIKWDPTLKSKILQQKKFRVLREQGSAEVISEIEASDKPAIPYFEDDSVFSMIFNVENRRKRFLVAGLGGEELSAGIVRDLVLIGRPGTSISINEYWFNVPNYAPATPIPSLPPDNDLGTAAVTFDEILQASIPDLDVQITGLSATIAAISERLRPQLRDLTPGDCQGLSDNLLCAEQNIQMESSDFARGTGVGQALFVNTSMRFQKQANASICLKWRIDQRQSETLTNCEGDGLVIDRDAGVIRVEPKFGPEHAKMLQIGNTRTSQADESLDFNDMPADQWIGQRVVMELSPAVWSDAYGVALSQIIEGRIFAEGEEPWLGAVFLREGDPASQRGFDRVVDLISR